MIKHGRGIALGWYGTGYGNGFPDVSIATVELGADGQVILRVGATEVGQGAKTIMPQICAEVLGLSPGRVTMLCEDTDTYKDSGTAAASRQTYNTGNAVLKAAKQFKLQLFEEAAKRMKLNSAVGLKTEDGAIWLEMLPEKATSFERLAAELETEDRILTVTETFIAQTTEMDSETGMGAPYWPYTFNAYGVEVDVNTDTGRVHVKKAYCVQDVGRAINPELVEGQIDGGFVMGLGYTLYEDLNVKDGVIHNNKFAKYIIPTAMDIPEIQKALIEEPESSAPFGAKGIGEPVMVPVAPAILNAIYDAIGVRILEVPATPEKVIEAIRKSGKQFE
jgi:CO/xanthine dehydrogenase Mo-binding subunit